MNDRLLVVDDDPTILRTLRINLKARGMDVETVTNGADALSAIDEQLGFVGEGEGKVTEEILDKALDVTTMTGKY